MTAPKVLLRKLGRNGPELNAIGLGCMGMSAFYGGSSTSPQRESESKATLQRALDLGCTFWDTADIYADNELFLSESVKANRSKVFLATKFGASVPGSTGFKPCSKPEYVPKAFERSIKRLDIDVVDLYYQHRVDPEVPIEETVKAMAELVKQGKVRYLGLSECSAETLRRAYAVHPIAAVQVEYSPWSLDIESNGLLAACKELGVAVVAYSPLGRGFLTGRIRSPEDFEKDDWRRTNPRFQGENFKNNLKLVEQFEVLAKKKGVTAGQLVLAWVLRQSDNIFVIPGTTKVRNLEENLAAADVTVTDEDDRAIREIVKSIGVAGTRYSEGGMKFVNM